MTMFRYKALFFLLTLLSLTAFAQIDDPVNVDTAIVRVNIGVVNKSGQSITNLDRANFKVFEDDVKQEISHFELSTAPFRVVMMLDMSGSTKSFRQNIALSAARFLDALAPEDRVSVIEFYSKVNVLNDFTTDRRIVLHSISAANGSVKKIYIKVTRSGLKDLRKKETAERLSLSLPTASIRKQKTRIETSSPN